MPYFSIVEMSRRANPDKPKMTRKQMLDRLREVSKRRGWQ